ncbi:MAG: insulinase family protein, partial [Proteobacteria bacterium]|nr:insulinase family protein [Pseudomonadota bacterium]
MLVYGDAVFSPLLKEEVFKQEGYHLEFEKNGDLTSGLKLVGVVYNEMKGNYSSPEYIASENSFCSLFPDTVYGFDAGGNPKNIPDLTYDDFINFHKKYYHPSNCKVFLYGNIPTLSHLEFLQENFFSKFSRLPVDSEISCQPRWPFPKKSEVTYPVKENDSLIRKSTVTLNWLTIPVTDPFKVLSLEVLSEILVGNAGAPLRKALIDSRLGEDMASATGLETELKEVTFSVGLRGTDPQSLEAVEEIVLDTLSQLKEKGVKQELVKSAIQRVEFRNREIRGGGAPYSLALMRKALRGWLHGAEPERTLKFDGWMKEIKKKAGEENFFTTLIDENLLSNPHRSTLLVRPDPEQTQREKRELTSRLKKFESALSKQKKEVIVKSLEKLKEFQENPDPPELLKSIPFLKLRDLPQQVEKIPSEKSRLASGIPVYFHDIFTNGVIYIDLAFNTSGLPDEYSRLLPLFGKAVCGSGLPGIQYDEVARMLSQYTGGFGYSLSASKKAGNLPGKSEHLFFRLKILRENLEAGLELVKNLLVEADFDDEKRFKDLTLELRNRLNASLIPNGHQFVSLRAGSNLSEALRVEEGWKGLSQVFYLAELSSDLKTNIKKIASSLKKVRKTVITRKNLIINLTTEKDLFEETSRKLSDLFSRLPEGETFSGVDRADDPERVKSEDTLKTKAESFMVATNIGFVSQAIRGARLGTKEHGYETVLSHFLRTGYLWEKVRMEGGAYGALATPNGTEGVFIFSSYRDPNIVETLKAFRESLDHVRSSKIEREEIERAIIGTVGLEERPLDPGDKGFISLQRELIGITDELRQKRREVVLRVTRDSLVSAADQLLDACDKGFSAVLSNKNAIDEASQILEDLKMEIQEVPI